MGTGKHQRRNRYGGIQRPSQFRPPLPIVVVVCDDTKTAVEYFRVLRREAKMKVHVDIVKAPRHGASADDVIALAAEQAQALAEGQNEAGDSVWVLIDREAERERQTKADQAKNSSKGKAYTVLLSNPCYEVWTLAHLADTGAHFKDCSAVVSRIKIEWKKKFGNDLGPKAQIDCQKLMPYRDEAVRRTQKRNPRQDQSWTEVYMAVEAITSFLRP